MATRGGFYVQYIEKQAKDEQMKIEKMKMKISNFYLRNMYVTQNVQELNDIQKIKIRSI